MRSAWRYLIVLTGGLLAAGLLGCARSGATRYHTLAPLALPSAAAEAPGGRDLGLGPVRLPEHLRQRALVSRLSPYQVRYCDFDLWAQPSEDSIGEVVSQNLARLTGTPRVARYPWRDGHVPAHTIVLEVTALEHEVSGQGVLQARWEIRDGAGRGLTSGEGTYREPAATVRELPAALSQALLRLSQDLAQALPR